MSRWLNLEADLVCVYYIIMVCAVENSVGRYNTIIIIIIIITCVITYNDDIIIIISDDNHRGVHNACFIEKVRGGSPLPATVV